MGRFVSEGCSFEIAKRMFEGFGFGPEEIFLRGELESYIPQFIDFHSWFMDSFKANNCFAECIRNDKATTTDYRIVYDLAVLNIVR